MFPGLLVLSAEVFPSNLDKYLTRPDPDTSITLIISNVTTTIVAVLVPILLIVTHWAVITIAYLSVVNNIEVLKGVLKRIQGNYLSGNIVLLLCAGFDLPVDVSIVGCDTNRLVWKNTRGGVRGT